MAAPTSSHLHVLVYGGAGALGRAVVASFKAGGDQVASVDFVSNPEASINYVLEGDFDSALSKLIESLDDEASKVTGTCRAIQKRGRVVCLPSAASAPTVCHCQLVVFVIRCCSCCYGSFLTWALEGKGRMSRSATSRKELTHLLFVVW